MSTADPNHRSSIVWDAAANQNGKVSAYGLKNVDEAAIMLKPNWSGLLCAGMKDQIGSLTSECISVPTLGIALTEEKNTLAYSWVKQICLVNNIDLN